MNIVGPILFQCKLNPLSTAICVPGGSIPSVNYGLLQKFIYNVMRTSQSYNIAPGNLVAVLVSDNILHLSLILGLMRIGAATLSLRDAKELPGIVPDLILTDVPGAFSAASTVLSVDVTWLEGDGDESGEIQAHDGSDDDICRIILTSGSTGVPKGIAFSHKLLADRISYYTYSKGPRFARCSRFFCDLGIATSPGFRYAMSLLSRGGTIYFLGPDPADILQAIDLHKIEGMATSPYGLAEFLQFFEAEGAFDLNFDHIICQGAMLSRELMRRARARMCQNLYCSYGSTETTTVAFGPASVIESIPGAIGYIQPGVTVEAVDGSGRVLSPMQDGVLRIRSNYMAQGYVGDPETTQAFFRNGYFYTGDIGHTTPEGLLVVTGREKTALNIGGETISPETVENIIMSFPDVREAGVFAANNALGVAELRALIVANAPVDETALRNFCAKRLPPSCASIRFFVVQSLPRGAQGKPERHRFPEIAAAHQASC